MATLALFIQFVMFLSLGYVVGFLGGVHSERHRKKKEATK
jgi:hypothetical protein